jgi:hypothetical protein
MIFERFDGEKQAILCDKLKDIFDNEARSEDKYKQFQIVNVGFDIKGNRMHWIKEKPYIPTKWAINSYVDKLWLNHSGIEISYNDIKVAKTNMAQQEMNSQIAKLNLLGTQWKLVEYNTIGIITSDNKVKIYSMQPNIL